MLLKLIPLIITFFKIGAFSFGGGYAMIPLFEKEILLHGWSSTENYNKVIAIAQMVPGPFAINSSAYIGYAALGMTGAVIASLALATPSFLASLLIVRYYVQFKSNCYIQLLLKSIRPAVIGLLVSAVYIIGVKPLISGWSDVASLTSLKAALMVTAGFIIHKKLKINPILFIFLSAAAGMIIF